MEVVKVSTLKVEYLEVNPELYLDMDMSDDAPLDADGASSEAVGGPEDNGSESDNEQEDEIDVEDNERDVLAEEDEEEQEDEVSFNSLNKHPRCSFRRSYLLHHRHLRRQRQQKLNHLRPSLD